MLGFVNAKINIGLQIVNRRADGYHDLQTIFYPVGLYAGSPENPVSFCDVLDVVLTDRGDVECEFGGREILCSLEKNLVYRAAVSFFEYCRAGGLLAGSVGCRILMEKVLPDGAGMGGGSADAGFTLLLLRRLVSEKFGVSLTDAELAGIAVGLGADCPFFIYNRPMYGSGIGEKLEGIDLDLSGYWLLVVKPDVYVSTREAFARVHPREGEYDLRKIPDLPIEEWRGKISNDFEDSIYPQYPVLGELKEGMYETGALYASLTGSGSCIYGIYSDRESGEKAENVFRGISTISTTYLLKL